MDDSLPPLIRALCHPRLYPGKVQRVDVLQTHGAWVLLAGDSAFKIKKPVRFDFMDFSTLALRRAACTAELRVNRRFAPGAPANPLYLQVLPIVGTPQNPHWGRPGEDDAEAFEFAVHMRRFDEAGRLDHLCARGELRPAHMVQLARSLARIQSQSDTAPAGSSWGLPQTVQVAVLDNLRTLQPLTHHPEDRQLLESLQQWTEHQWPAVSAALAQRRAAGQVREGHGDLHLANLVLLGEEVVAFDAIEFNDALRWVDTAGDLAFAWMDLQAIGAAGLAHLLLSEWMDASGDVSAPDVLPFFAVYLALVRAKVAALRRAQLPPGDAAARAACDAGLRQYLQLAARLAWPEGPRLLITHGLSGSGKSHAATGWLMQHAGPRALRLRSDVERKRLHGLAPLQASDPARRGAANSTGCRPMSTPMPRCANAQGHCWTRAGRCWWTRPSCGGASAMPLPGWPPPKAAPSASWPHRRPSGFCASGSPSGKRGAPTRPKPRCRCSSSSCTGSNRWARTSRA